MHLPLLLFAKVLRDVSQIRIEKEMKRKEKDGASVKNKEVKKRRCHLNLTSFNAPN